MTIQYQEHDMDDVFRHFVKDFKPADGQKIYNWEAWFDSAKASVVFKLYLKQKDE